MNSGSRFLRKDYDKGGRGQRLMHSGRRATSRRKTLTVKTGASPKLDRKGVSIIQWLSKPGKKWGEKVAWSDSRLENSSPWGQTVFRRGCLSRSGWGWVQVQGSGGSREAEPKSAYQVLICLVCSGRCKKKWYLNHFIICTCIKTITLNWDNIICQLLLSKAGEKILIP